MSVQKGEEFLHKFLRRFGSVALIETNFLSLPKVDFARLGLMQFQRCEY